MALAVVAYHAALAEPTAARADRTADLRTCKRLRDAMDASSAPFAQLMAKLPEARAAASAAAGTAAAATPAEAGSILVAWKLAADHWQQALSQRHSTTNVNNMSAADPEVTRQVVAQVMPRAELTDASPSSDAAISEVYGLLGLPRLLVTEEARPWIRAPTPPVRVGDCGARTARATWNALPRGCGRWVSTSSCAAEDMPSHSAQPRRAWQEQERIALGDSDSDELEVETVDPSTLLRRSSALGGGGRGRQSKAVQKMINKHRAAKERSMNKEGRGYFEPIAFT